jgi:hypothetical protein
VLKLLLCNHGDEARIEIREPLEHALAHFADATACFRG